MEIYNTNDTTYKISVSGYNKKTPRKLKYIADCILILIPAVDGILLAAPVLPHRDWIIFGWTTFGILFKGVTKFIEEMPKEDEES